MKVEDFDFVFSLNVRAAYFVAQAVARKLIEAKSPGSIINMRGPQRRPAGTYRGKKFGFIGKPEEALELAGEVGAGTVLDQRGGAHHTEWRNLALLAPGGKQGIENFGRNGTLIKCEPDLN